jgi:polysaccharide deacetylase 2 family uncharacterized protein YibQ
MEDDPSPKFLDESMSCHTAILAILQKMGLWSVNGDMILDSEQLM